MNEQEWLTTQEVAQILRMTPNYVQRQCASGNLRAKRLGTKRGVWRIRRSDVDAFMAGPRTVPTARERRRAS